MIMAQKVKFRRGPFHISCNFFVKGRIFYMKLYRLLAITLLLINRERIQAKELADTFEVSMGQVILIFENSYSNISVW